MAYAPGIDLGTLKLLPEANRSSSYQLNGATTTGTWTDCWGAEVPNPYVPKGAKAIRVKFALQFAGNGAYDYARALLRKNGSTTTAAAQLADLVAYDVDAPADGYGSQFGEVDVLCDENGIIEYYIYAASGGRAAGTLYLNTIGYWM